MARFYILCFLLLSASLVLSTSAQELPDIQLDRPDQTECPYTVPKNHFQVENGFNYEKVSEIEKNFLYPTSLWKFGVNDNMELRVITELTTNQVNGVSTSGLNPVRIGFKTNLWKENGLLPLTSFIGHLEIPSLSTKEFATTYYAPSFRFTLQNSLSENISLGYNLGAEWDGETAEPTFIYTLTTGFSLSEKFGAYVELYGFAPQHASADHRFDGGFSYMPQGNIIMDLSGGFGITENSPLYYGSLGFSIRLPN